MTARTERISASLAARSSPRVALAVAVVAVSTSAILIRWSRAPPVVAAFYRVLLTTLILAPLTVHRHRGSVATLSRRHLLAAGATGFALAVHFAAFFESLSSSPSRSSSPSGPGSCWTSE